MRTRLIIGYAAAASALPYLTLKGCWLAGIPVGLNDPGMLDDHTLFVANAVTAGMQLVGALLALGFTHRWGRRIPAWLVAFPMWVGTGLLAPIGVSVVLILATRGLPPEGALQNWVYLVVYGGFSIQGVLLALAFLHYARDRWPGLLADRAERPGPTRALQVLLAWVAAALASVTAAVELYWGLGGPAGLPDGTPATSTFVVNAALTLAAAAGLLAMAHRRRPFGAALIVTWIGSGAMFGWGLWAFVRLLQGTALDTGHAEPGILDAVDALKVLAAMLIGTVSAFLLVERQAVTDAPVAGTR
ncbi:hypothetical protein R8Z50_24350 [Longispora sp. K20-0274]|uniref:hypothetical protein n=1 Tax=Longispora sp. K20-0274 TaxID=3088255 RepID=UPI003999672B